MAEARVRVLQAVSVGMFWLKRDAPAACVAPDLELEEDTHHQQQAQVDGEQDAGGKDLRQKPAAAEWRPTLSMRTVSSTAVQRCAHADAGAQDARASGQDTRERACVLAMSYHIHAGGLGALKALPGSVSKRVTPVAAIVLL